jgi:hypothetical protein
LISGPNGILAVYGGIGSHYLNNEGGENGRLGAPTSGEIQVGGGKIVQRFQKGDILYGSGATSTLLTAGSAINYVNEFTAVVMPGVGVALRNTPREGDRSGYARNFNDTIRFDAWTTGDTLIDTRLGTPDNKWYHIKGTNYWVPSAYVNGDPGRSVIGNNATLDTQHNFGNGNQADFSIGANNSGNSSSTSSQSNISTQLATNSAVFVIPGQTSSTASFLLQNQSIWGGGNGFGNGFLITDKLNPTWNVGPVAIALSAGYKLEAFGSAGLFNINLPSAFDINWSQSEDKKFVNFNFNSKLSSSVVVETTTGFGLAAKADVSLATSFNLFGIERKTKAEVSAQLDLLSLTNLVTSPVALDLGLSAKKEGTNRKITLEDTATQSINIINALSWLPQTKILAETLKLAGVVAKISALIKQESTFNINGFEIDYDGQINGNEITVGLNESKTLSIPIPIELQKGQFFNFTPTIRPITTFQSIFKLSGKIEAGIDTGNFSKSLVSTLSLPDITAKLLEGAIPKASFLESIEVPIVSIPSSKEFDPFKWNSAISLNTIRILTS